MSKESHLDLLVAAAGIPGPATAPDSSDAGTLFEKLWANETPAQWADTYSTNVTAVYFTTKDLFVIAVTAPLVLGLQLFVRRTRVGPATTRASACCWPSGTRWAAW